MLAQEAIEITEEKLRRLNVIFTEMNYDLMTIKEEKRIQYWTERIDKVKKEIEALKIVLESAKHLHMYIDVIEKNGGFIETYTHEGWELEPFMTMTVSVAEKLGIEAQHEP